MAEQSIEKLCEKFGVTADNLINELFRYNTTMDKIGIVVWSTIIILSIILFFVFKQTLKRWYYEDSLKLISIVFPISFSFAGIIILPYLIIDLIGWYISPISCALKIIFK